MHVQIVVAFCRPRPNGENTSRVAMFSNAHLIIGRLSKLLAVVNIFLGLLQPLLQLPLWLVVVVTSLVFTSAMVELALLNHQYWIRSMHMHSDTLWRQR
jgi:hypothetical protein